MSFLSVEPQSRVVLENYSDILLAQFDSQLGIIEDRYLAFFRERRTIEATYINSLRKLHHKAKTVDASFDPSAEPSTTRAAWDTIRDNLEQEANTKQAFVDILVNDVIKPLVTFQQTKDETRDRIKSDLKVSASQYTGHAENRILKLQVAYFKKYHPRFTGRRSALSKPEPAKSEVSDNDFWEAACVLNTYRLRRVENLRDGYDCLEELVFAPTAKNAIVKYIDGMITASAQYDNLAISTGVKVEKALAIRDTSESDLRASFRSAISFSIPPHAFYRDYCPGAQSDLVFGAPLVDLATDEDKVPKVMRMCIEEVEKRGLSAHRIYSATRRRPAHQFHSDVVQLRRRVESEKSFSFKPTDDIYAIALLLERYLLELPEPLFVLPMRYYRDYMQMRAIYTENNFSLLRSKINELHPVHRASLEALMRHLSRVASHSENNETTVEALAAKFCFIVFRGNVWQDKAHIKGLIMEDLIRNVHTLFDERPSSSTTVPSPQVVETIDLPQSSQVDAMDSTTRQHPGLVGIITTSTHSSFSSLPLDVTLESRVTQSSTSLPSPLLGLPSTNILVEGVEATSQEQFTPKVGGSEVADTLANGPPPEIVDLPPTSITEWRLRQSQLPPEPVPHSPPESVLSSTTDLTLSSNMSL